MSMAPLETAILTEIREIVKNPKLRKKDILEWSTGEPKQEPNEVIVELPKLHVKVAILKENDKRENQK